MSLLIISLTVLGMLGFLMGIGLGIASKKFAVQNDPRIEAITQILPGANCGACGFAGCVNYARTIIEGNVKPTACSVGGPGIAEKIAAILDIEISVNQPQVARVHCGGDLSERRHKGAYEGIKTCSAASLVAGGGNVMCGFSCLGFGDCIKVCPFHAINPKQNLPPEIDPEKCTACGLCIAVCPKEIIKLIPKDKQLYVACSSTAPGKLVRQVCDTGCIACGLCMKKAPDAAIIVENNLATIDYSKWQNHGEYFKSCPTKCILWKN